MDLKEDKRHLRIERVKKKLPALLVNGPLTVRSELYKYQVIRCKLRRLERRKPGKLDLVAKEICRLLGDLERCI